jgi:hypothetical protein
VAAGLPVNLADGDRNTLLMLACYHDQLETARMLLARGAEVDRRNSRNQTPLGGVAFKGYVEVARLLLKNGAAVDADNGNGMTPLMFAEMFGRTDVAEILRAAGADPKSRSIPPLRGSGAGTPSATSALRAERGCGSTARPGPACLPRRGRRQVCRSARGQAGG